MCLCERAGPVVRPFSFPLEEDSPELKAELLKAIDGPYTPYAPEEMRGLVERIIREEKRG